jgi:hypothetical protein
MHADTMKYTLTLQLHRTVNLSLKKKLKILKLKITTISIKSFKFLLQFQKQIVLISRKVVNRLPEK